MKTRCICAGIVIGILMTAGLKLFAASINMSAGQNSISIDGLVTGIVSQMAFNAGKLHVIFGDDSRCVVETAYTLKARAYPFGNIPAPYIEWKTSKSINKKNVPCNTLHLSIGLRIQLTGIFQKNKYFLAKRVVAFKVVPSETLDGASLIEETDEPLRRLHGKSRTLWIDGYPMTISEQDGIIAASDRTTLNYSLHPNGTFWIHIKAGSSSKTKQIAAAQVEPNTWVVYDATRSSDGAIIASQLHLWPDLVDVKEKAYLERTTPIIHEPDYSKSIYGRIQFKHNKAAEILPEQKVENFVSMLGMEEVPQYEKDINSSDTTKINFKFYVVMSTAFNPGKGLLDVDGRLPKCNIVFTCGDSMLRFSSPIKDIVATPNGVILIPDSMLIMLQNKAQLASLLSYAITSVVQKQAYIARPLLISTKARWHLLANSGGASEPFVQSFGVWLNEQVLRIGIRQMYLAGYDIREAPFAWAVAQGKPVQNPIINSKHPDQEIPWYAAYAFNYISHYYSDVDYSKLKRGEKEYQQFLQELYKADPSLPRPQAQLEPQASTRPRAAAQPAPQSSPAAPTASAPPATPPVAPSSATPAITQAH